MMKKLKTNILSALLMGGFALAGLSACDDDDVTIVALPQPVVEQIALSHNAMAFQWEAIPGATQYGYELLDSEGRQAFADVTRQTSVSFEGLQPATAYTFNVWAYAPVYTENGTSAKSTVAVNTNALKVLEAPLVVKTENGVITSFDWEPIDNADGYRYILSILDGGSGRYVEKLRRDVWNNHVEFRCLPLDDYQVTVLPLCSADGYATEGEGVAVEFEVTETRELTAKDFTGAFYVYTTGIDWVNSAGDTFEYNYEVKLASVPGGAIQFPGLFWENYPVKGKFDPATKTFTFAAQKWGDYTFAGYAGVDVPVTGYVSWDNNEITLDDWTGYYSDGSYYMEATHSAYTRK